MGIPVDAMMVRAAAIAFRVAGAFTFMPFFGSAAIPIRIKATLVLVFTFLLFPQVPVNLPTLSATTVVPAVLSEVMLGLLMGLCLQFVFEAVQVAGQIVGFQLSFSLVNVIDPQTNVDTPVLANLQQLVALLLFLQMNVHHWILRAMERSFERVPPGSVSFSREQLHGLFTVAGNVWSAGLQLAAPVILATVVLDVTIGFVSKAAPQIPVLFLSIPMKTMIGFLVLALALGVWPGFFEKQFSQALTWSWQALDGAR